VSDATITFAVLIGIVAFFIWGRFPVEVVAVASAVVLAATGVLTIDQSLAGFGDQVVIFIAALFVVSEGLDSSGVTAWAGQLLIDRAGSSRTRLVVLMMVMVAVLTAFVTVNAAVAALLPVVVVIAVRLGIPASKLLIPLCFGSHAGSQLALTGSNVNLLVSNALLDTTGSPFGFFEFALVGVPLTIGTIAVVTLLADRLLPVRTPKTVSADLSDHARTLARSYGLPADAGTGGPIGRDEGLIEIVIPPRSPFVGERVVKGMRTEDGHLVISAIQRGGRDIGDREVELAVGDALLLSGPWDALEARADDRGFLVVDRPEAVRRQAVPLGPKAFEAIAVLLGMIALLVTGAVTPAVAGLLAAGALIVLGVVTIERAYRSITWTTVVLVAGMLPLSTAMIESGAADLIAESLIDVVGGLGPTGLLIGLFVVTAVFGQLISNTATALIMIPIGIAATGELGIDPRPVLMSLSVAASAALLTPVATPVNLIAMGAAGYRFGDYWRLGLATMAVFFVVAVFLVPVFWPF
jgi:di/tricarboxylate transporter